MLSDLYSSKALGIIVAILYLFALIPYTSAQLKGVGELFAQIGLVNGYEIGVAFAATATLLWTVVAGMWSVAITDAYQGIWMLGSAIAITVWLYTYLLPSTGVDYARFVEVSSNAALWRFNWSAQMFIGMTLPWLFFALTNPQVVQRLYIPKDEKAFRRMLSYFATYGLLYTIICVALGVGYRVYMDVTGLTQQFIRNRDAVAPYIIAKSHAVLAVARSASTANTCE
jgi:SSS family solute:Na+ symporter